MSGFGAGGMGSGGKGSGGMAGKRSGGDASGGREHERGVRFPQGDLPAYIAGEKASSGRAAGVTPQFVYQDRSGASEHDQYFFPHPRGDVATTTTGPPGRISAGQKAARPSAAGVPPSLREDVRRACADIRAAVEPQIDRLVDALKVLKNENDEAGDTIAQQKKILGVRKETIQILSEQLAEARRQIQALEAPAAVSQLQNAGPSNYRSSLDARPSRFRGDITITPKSADDVFGEGSWSSSHGTGKQALQAPTFEQKPLTELLSNCFNNVEAALRKVPILDVVPKNMGSPTHSQRQIIMMLQQHLESKKTAYEMLKDETERYSAMVALVSHTIVDNIFKDQIIGTNANFAGRAYLKAYEEEQEAARYDHPRVRDLHYRNGLAEQRASAAQALVGAQGFWKWLNSTIYSRTEQMVRELGVCFPVRFHYNLTQDLNRAMSEAIRIAVRIRTEPNLVEYSFPPLGTPWASKFHVHRNPELSGQTLSDDKSPYCVRVATMPLIKSKSFANNSVIITTIHKAVVIVGDRAGHLPQMDRRR